MENQSMGKEHPRTNTLVLGNANMHVTYGSKGYTDDSCE